MAMLPDADYLLKFVSDITYLRYHRGITHSILLLPLWAWLCYSLLPRRRHLAPSMPWMIAVALAVHVLLDLVTSFGTMIFAPVSELRATLDLVFIIDPIFTSMLLVPLLCMMVMRRQARLLGIIGLAAMTSYLALTLFNHEQGIRLTRLAHPDAASAYALPQPFSPFRWQLIASYPQYESRAFVDLWPAFKGTAVLFSDTYLKRHDEGFEPPETLNWQRLPAMRAFTDINGLPGVDFYRWFARFPVLLRRDDTIVEFADLRFDTGTNGESAFRLRIELKDTPKAWLVWRGDRKSEITEAIAPGDGWLSRY